MNSYMDFRRLPVIPGAEELLRGENNLPVNKAFRVYDSLLEYLNTHFRLLREDLIAPYRNAIKELRHRAKHSANGRLINDVQLYNEVKLVCLRPEQGGMEFALRIGEVDGHKEYVDWYNSKLLMHNSLLCMSCDGFATFFWAVVSSRRPQELSLSMTIGVRPLDGFIRPGTDFNEWIERDKEYTMFEATSAFFEAYQHVLEVLQRQEIERIDFLGHLLYAEQFVGEPEYYRVFNNGGGVAGSEDGWVKELESELRDSGVEWGDGVAIGSEKKTSDGFDESDGDECVVLGSESKQVSGQPGSDPWGNQSSGTQWENQSNNSQWGNGKKEGGSVWDMNIGEMGSVENHVNGNEKKGENGNPKNIWGDTIETKNEEENHNRWPDVDHSQQEAITHGLTKKLAVIQGPAGTGKTFVGLQIAKTLLSNYSNPNPIVVVCYTNRALDQFLEGIYEHEKCLVRLGTGSKSTTMAKCNLERFKKKYKVKVAEHLRKEKAKLLTQRDSLGEQLIFTEQCMRAKLVSRQALLKVAHRRHYDSLYFCDACNADDIYNSWLIGNEKKHPSPTCSAYSADSPLSNMLPDSGLELSELGDNDNPETIELSMEYSDSGDVWSLDIHSRRRLHVNWLHEMKEYGKREFWKLAYEYEDVCNKLQRVKAETQVYVLCRTRVLGMTTTVAARYFDVLSAIRPAIMIVEEAAEVLEGQLLACLNPHIKHLILIGDHMQLRPSISSTSLSRYDLDISMFERLISNGIEFKTLQVQRRMRPAIAYLVEGFYPLVKDHKIVKSMCNVRGVDQNVFFFDHGNPELCLDNSVSRVNAVEAELVAEFALFLINRCHYTWKDITILSMYRSQIIEISKLLSNRSYMGRKRQRGNYNEGVPKVRSVDEFQGEESNIIILSLVRNRTHADQWSHPDQFASSDSIGFLGSGNRICVALTRAKMGLYIFGNSDLLSTKSTIWEDIINRLRENGRIGSRMKIKCPFHKDEVFRVRTVDDFQGAYCKRKCNSLLKCGHPCPKLCHAGDHEDISCGVKCFKKLDCGHTCQKYCHFDYPGECSVYHTCNQMERRLRNQRSCQTLPVVMLRVVFV